MRSELFRDRKKKREKEKMMEYISCLYIHLLCLVVVEVNWLDTHTRSQIVLSPREAVISLLAFYYCYDANPHTHRSTHPSQALVVNCTSASALSMPLYLWLYTNEMLILFLPPEEMDENQGLSLFLLSFPPLICPPTSLRVPQKTNWHDQLHFPLRSCREWACSS